MKKVVVLGGGTGLSTLLRGLKQFPIDITAIVAVSDDGKSSGRLREEFNVPAVGDIRQVIISLSETEPLFKQLLNYRFKTNSDLNDHALGNLLLTGLIEVAGNMATGIESLSKILNLKGKVLPLTEECVTLIAETQDGEIIEGEHNIGHSNKKIKKVYYQKEPKILDEVINQILTADLIILSMGSLYTSIIPNLLSKEMIEAIDKSKAKIMYVCNIVTQPGETDNYKASDHIKAINQYLGEKKVSVIIANSSKISKEIEDKYLTLENKNIVILDKKELKKIPVEIISDNLVSIESGTLRHNDTILGLKIYSYLIL